MKTVVFGKAAIFIFSLVLLCKGIAADPKQDFNSFLRRLNLLPRRYYSATICVRVMNDAGQPVRGASVSTDCTHYNYPKRYTLMSDLVAYYHYTDQRGLFEFRRQVPGNYIVSASGEKYLDASQTLRVGPNSVTTVNLTLHK